MCLQPRKHTVLPCHLCLLSPSPVLNFPVPYFLSSAVWKQKRQMCTYFLIHCLLFTPGWQGTLIWFSSWASSLSAPRALSWLRVLGNADVSWCLQTWGCQSVQWLPLPGAEFSVQNMDTRVTDCRHWMLNQSQFPSFSKTGWITLLNVSPALCKWGNLIRVSSLAPLRAVCVQQVMGVCLQWDYQRLENQTEQTFKHNLFNSLVHFSPSFIPSVCWVM